MYEQLEQDNEDNTNTALTVKENNVINFSCSKDFFRIKSLTFLIFFLNLLVFSFEMIDMYIINRNRKEECIFYDLGAFYAPKLSEFQFYRLICAIFLHSSLEHLLSNCLSLPIGMYLENNLGSKNLMKIYFLSGIYGYLLTGIFDSNINLGANGSVFGLNGFFIIFYVLNFKKINFVTKIFFGYIIYNLAFSVLGLLNVFSMKIDYFGQLGGIFTGMFLTLIGIGENYDKKIFDENKINLFRKIGYIFMIVFPFVCYTLIFVKFYGKEEYNNICN